MSLRPQDPLPDWITHAASVDGSKVSTGPRASASAMPAISSEKVLNSNVAEQVNATREIPSVELVHMKDVNVRYHERHVRAYRGLCDEIYSCDSSDPQGRGVGDQSRRALAFTGSKR